MNDEIPWCRPGGGGRWEWPMLRTHAEQVSLWEAVLPERVLRLPEELSRVDALLEDPVFFAPFAPFFDPRMGRPSRRRWKPTCG